jgi:hypothetical protein
MGGRLLFERLLHWSGLILSSLFILTLIFGSLH